MKHSENTERFFVQVLAETPPEIKQDVEWTCQIADKIYAAIHSKGLSQKNFA